MPLSPRHRKTSFDLATLDKGWLLEKISLWFSVTAIDNAGKREWSIPVWFDVDGKHALVFQGLLP